MGKLKIAEELKDIIKDVIKSFEKDVYYCDLVNIDNTLAIDAWRVATNTFTTPVLPRGKYLVIAGATYSGYNATSPGLATTRVMFDGSELGFGSRQTIPISQATMTYNSANVINITGDSDKTHTVALQVYPILQPISGCTWARIIFVKL